MVSPKDAFRVAIDLGIIDNPDEWFVYLKDRNESAHLYDSDKAQLVFSHVPSFITAVDLLVEKMSRE